MEQHDRSTSRAGFTLIELLVFIAIFTLIIGSFIAILVSTINVQSQQIGLSDVEQQGQFVTQQLQYYIEGARLIDMPVDTATTTLTVRESSSSIDPTVISVSSGTFYIQQGGGAPIALTSNKVTASSVSFTRHYNLNSSSSALGTDSISYSFNLSGGTIGDPASDTFQSSFSVLTPIPAIAMLQQAKGESNTSSISSMTTGFSRANEKGDLLIAVVATQTASSSGVSDTASDTWNIIQNVVGSSTTGLLSVYSAIATSSNTSTVTVSFHSGAGYGSVFLYEYRGATTSSAYITSNPATQTTASPSSSYINSTSTQELLFGVDFGKSLSQAPTAGSGYTFETSSTASNTTQIFVEDQVQYVTSPQQSTWQYSSAVTTTPTIFIFH